jgi:predicted acyltransferase
MEPGRRLRSLDAFRGFDIAAMILVNMTWDSQRLPRQMFHVGWNAGEQGVTFTDLVFPWFLFIAGLSLPFSMHSGRGRELGARGRLLAGLRRALTLYTLGLILDAAGTGTFLFLKWNILQLIAAAYLFALALLHTPRWVQAAFVVLVLAGKWYLLSVLPHPQFGASVWFFAVDGVPVADRYAPGAVPVNGEQLVKSWVLGAEADLPWSGAVAYGPLLGWLTGLFNALPAACVTLAGAWVGEALRRDTHPRRPGLAAWLMGLGLVIWLASWLLNLHHPWSKDFFTASYALLAIGTGMGLMGVFYLLLDAEPRIPRPAALVVPGVVLLAAALALTLSAAPVQWLEWAWGAAVLCWLGLGLHWWPRVPAFFRVLGVNAIAIYFTNELLFKMVLSRWRVPAVDDQTNAAGALYAWLRGDWLHGSEADLVLGGWAFAVIWLAGCWVFAAWLDHRRLYLKV